MSDFGDWEEDDAFATEPADPEQVAIILHRLRRDEGLDDGFAWEELTPAQRAVLIIVMSRFIDLWRRQGLR